MMMLMTEAGLSGTASAPSSAAPTPSRARHQHQRTASSAVVVTSSTSTSSSTMAAIAALERSHSYTEATMLAASSAAAMEECSGTGTTSTNHPPLLSQQRLSATITEVLQSLSMLSTETAAGEDTEEQRTHPLKAGVEESSNNNDDHNSFCFNGDASSFRRSSIDVTMLEGGAQEEGGGVPPPPASLQTPVMPRQTLSASLCLVPPTHKREHSATSWGNGCMAGFNYHQHPGASTARQHQFTTSHPYFYGGGSASKKSRSGSFILIQSAPHLPLSPELDVSRSSALCFEGPEQQQAPSADEAGGGTFDAKFSTAHGGGVASSSAGADAPVIWKSHIQLPPPLFSPLLYQPDSGPESHPSSDRNPAAACALAGSVQPPLPQELQRRDDVGDRGWSMEPPPPPLAAPPLQPELRSFDEHDDSQLAGRGEGGVFGPRLQQRRPQLLGELPMSTALFLPLPSTSSLVPLPPPMPLMSSPSPSPKVGRRILRMRKADAIDLTLP